MSIEPSPTGTELRVCQDIAARQAIGLAKYGTTVAENPLSLREWLQHAYEETLDKAIYLRRAIEQIDAVLGRISSPRLMKYRLTFCRRLPFRILPALRFLDWRHRPHVVTRWDIAVDWLCWRLAFGQRRPRPGA